MRGTRSQRFDMNATRPSGRSIARSVMVCNGLLGFQYVAAVVTRDVLFLSSLNASARPLMVALSAVVWLLLTALNSRLRRASLAVVITSTFGVGSAVTLLDWMFADSLPAAVSRAFFLQTAALGPLLGSAFWLVFHRVQSPRDSKMSLGRVMGAGTLGGVIGALVAGRLPQWVGVTSMLPVLAAINLLIGWQLWRLARVPAGYDSGVSDESLRDIARQITSVGYVPTLAGVLFLGAMSAACAEHLMNVLAQNALPASALPGFFSTYYLLVSVAGLAVQITFATRALERLGMGLLVGSSSIVLAAGSVGAWLVPGLASVTIAYAGSSVVYESLFRRAYEQFFSAVQAAERRAIKPIVDGLFNRLGAAAGGAAIWLLALAWPERLYHLLLAATVLCCGGAVLLARRVPLLYIRSLERSLMTQATELDIGDIETQRTVTLRGLTPPHPSDATAVVPPAGTDRDVAEIQTLRSRNRDAILDVLERDGGPPAALIPHIIPLLASDVLANTATQALRSVASKHVGTIVDAMLDPDQPFAVRRRLPNALIECFSQRAVDGLLLGLDDLRFDVRFQCARTLSAIQDSNLVMRIDRERVFDAIRREVAVGRPVWEARRPLDTEEDAEPSPMKEFFVDRSKGSLGHVFTLMSLVLPKPPLKVAYRALHVDDRNLRGTALEYLDGVLPIDIRDRLWEFLEEQPRPADAPRRSPEELMANLLGSNHQIVMNLEKLRQRATRD